MSAVIRSAQISASRMRLSETPANDDALRGRSQLAAADVLRTQIEQELRAQVQAAFEVERKRAQTEGYAAGLAEARRATETALAEQRAAVDARIATVLSTMEQAHVSSLSKLEASAGTIAFAAVCRLLGSNATTPSFVLGLVEQACKQLRGDESATVRLHPRDIELLGARVREGELKVGSFTLAVIADESLELGGCVLDAASGQYDASLAGQLSRLHQLLMDKPSA